MRTKVQIHDLEDRGPESLGRAPTTDSLGGFVFQDAGGGHATGTVVILDEGVQIGVFTELRFIGSGVQAFNSGSYAAIAITGSAAAPGPGGGSGAMIVPAYSSLTDSTTRTYTANTTWENIAGCSGTFVVDRASDVIVEFACTWRGTTGNWEYNFLRLLLDGVQVQTYWRKSKNGGPQNSERYMFAWHVFIQGLASGTHGFVVQTYDAGSALDRAFYVTSMQIQSPNGGTRWVETGV